jgi:hypothetical protein
VLLFLKEEEKGGEHVAAGLDGWLAILDAQASKL